MGSFNLSCSFSKLDIKKGDSCVLYFLLPKNFSLYKDKYELERTPYLTSSEDMYKSFLLPIYGRYNDFGGLEKIIKDKNVETLENFFNLNIQKIIEATQLNFIEEKLYNADNLFYINFFNKKILNSNSKLDTNFFNELNMKHNEENNSYILPSQLTILNQFIIKIKESQIEIFIRSIFSKEEKFISSFEIKGKNNKEKKLCFLNNIYKHTKILLGYTESDAKRISILKNMSLMFVLKKYFDFSINKLGEMTNDIDKLSNKNIIENEINDFATKIKGIVTINRYEDFKKEDMLIINKNIFPNPVDFYEKVLNTQNSFAYEFCEDKNILTFSVYLKNILKNDLIDAFVENYLFSKSISLCNLHFTPTIIGRSQMWMDKKDWNFLIDIEKMKIEDLKECLKDK